MSGDVLTRIPQDRHNIAAEAARNLQRIKDKIRSVKPGEDIATGLRAIDTADHTQGHIAIEIVSGNGGYIGYWRCSSTPSDCLRAPGLAASGGS